MILLIVIYGKRISYLGGSLLKPSLFKLLENFKLMYACSKMFIDS